MTANVIYSGDLRCTLTHQASGETVISDAPVDNHGKGQAFSPTDMAAASLASCMLTVMGIYAESKQIDMNGANASVKKTMASDPRRISKVEVAIRLPKHIEPSLRGRLEQIGRNCPVAKSLHPELEQVVSFSWDL